MLLMYDRSIDVVLVVLVEFPRCNMLSTSSLRTRTVVVGVVCVLLRRSESDCQTKDNQDK